jgi:hypothetical protein
MSEELTSPENSEKPEKTGKNLQVKVQNTSDTLYSIGLIGAWVYYIGRATTFEERLKGFLKGLVWPAILVRKMLEFYDKE